MEGIGLVQTLVNLQGRAYWRGAKDQQSKRRARWLSGKRGEGPGSFTKEVAHERAVQAARMGKGTAGRGCA